MRTSVVKNGLVMVVIVLFIGIAVQPVIAIVDKELKTDIEIEENEKFIGRGFIVCRTRIWNSFRDFYMPASWTLVSCEDLDTGMIRFGLTHYLGFHIFKFLPMEHNYKLNAYPISYWDGEQTLFNLSYLDVAIFTLNHN